MKLSTRITALATAAIGAAALGSAAAADVKTVSAAAGPAPVSINVRIPIGAGVTHRLDDGHTVVTYSYTDGVVWINAPWVDVRKCTVAPVVGSGRPVLVTHENVDYRDWTLLFLWAVNGTSRASAVVDVTMTCPASAVTATAQRTDRRVTPPKLPRR